MPTDCVFCDLVADGKGALGPTVGTVLIEPLNPVTPGHLLVISRRHFKDFTEDPEQSGYVMRDAAEVAQYMRRDGHIDLNIITSVGLAATQSVFHLHIHLVPRRIGDGLHLPWTGQARAAEERGASFTCPNCGATSYNPNDVAESYCGKCHDWTAQP